MKLQQLEFDFDKADEVFIEKVEPPKKVVTCHKYCSPDDLQCDYSCGFAACILQYFRGEGNYYPENFPYGIPMEVVERIRQSIYDGKITGNFRNLGVYTL